VKNLLAFSAFLAAGFLLGSRRARKAGPIKVMSIAVEVDTSQAMPALYRLQKQAEKTTAAVEALAAGNVVTDPWVDEREAKPADGEEVYVSVVRRAVRVEGKWELKGAEPIDLEVDAVQWMKIPVD
jgi:hypothetical protein